MVGQLFKHRAKLISNSHPDVGSLRLTSMPTCGFYKTYVTCTKLHVLELSNCLGTISSVPVGFPLSTREYTWFLSVDESCSSTIWKQRNSTGYNICVCACDKMYQYYRWCILVMKCVPKTFGFLLQC